METNNLTTLLRQNNDYLASNIHTAMPAKVLNYDENTNSVDLELMLKDKRGNESFDFPTLKKVPCFMLQSSNFLISLPISKGDEGIVIFQEKDSDSWFISGSKKEANDARKHDLSDAVFIFGIFNFKRKIPMLDKESITIRNLNKTTFLKLSEQGIDILGNVNIVGNLTISGGVDASSAFTCKGNFDLKGNLDCAKNVTASDIISSGKSFNNHRHGGVETGGGTTGTPK